MNDVHGNKIKRPNVKLNITDNLLEITKFNMDIL